MAATTTPLRKKVTVEPVTNLAQLKAINTTDTSNGTAINVVELGMYGLDTGAAFTPDDNKVIEPTTGPGQWLKKAPYLFNDQFVSVSGTPAYAADYTSVKAAVDDGAQYIRVLGTTTDSSDMTISSPTVVDVYTGVTWTLDDSNITCNEHITVASDGYSTVQFSATSAPKTMFAGGYYVTLRNVGITNLSTQAGSKLAASGLSIYAFYMDYSAPNVADCGASTNVFSVFEDCYFYGGGSNCTLLLSVTGDGHLARCYVNGASATGTGNDPVVLLQNSQVVELVLEGMSTSAYISISNCTVTNVRHSGDLVNMYVENSGGTPMTTINSVKANAMNIYLRENGTYSDFSLNAGSVNMQTTGSLSSFCILSGSFSINSSADNCSVSGGTIVSGNFNLGTADNVTISNLNVKGSLLNSISTTRAKISNCYFEYNTNIDGDGNSLIGNTVGAGSTTNTLNILGSATNTIASLNYTDVVISDLSASSNLTNNYTF